MYKNKTILWYLVHSRCNRLMPISCAVRRYQLQSWAFVRSMCARVDVSWKGTKRQDKNSMFKFQHTIFIYMHYQAYQKRKNILILRKHLLAKFLHYINKNKCLWFLFRSNQRTLSVPFVVHNGMYKGWYLTQSIYFDHPPGSLYIYYHIIKVF